MPRKNIQADSVDVSGDLTVVGNVTVQGTSDIVAGDDLTVTGDLSAATVTATGAVSGASVSATGAVSGATVAATTSATVGTTLGVTGALSVAGGITVTTGQSVTINGVSYDYETEGVKQAAPNAGGRSMAQRVTNILNSVSVLGGVSGDNVFCRNAQVMDTLSVNKFGGSYMLGPASKDLTAASATTFVSVACPSNGLCAGRIPYTIIASDGTDFQTQTGILFFAAANKSGTVTYKLRDNLIGSDADTLGSGAGITNAFTAAEDADNTLAIKATAASDLTETTLRILYRVEMDYPNVITAA